MKINVRIDDIPFGTNIQDIKVPSVLKKRIPTGLKYFDAVIFDNGIGKQALAHPRGALFGTRAILCVNIQHNLFADTHIAVIGETQPW